jgi:hypothetical protein
MGLRWRYVLILSQPKHTLTTARRVNTGSYRLVRLRNVAITDLKIRCSGELRLDVRTFSDERACYSAGRFVVKLL